MITHDHELGRVSVLWNEKREVSGGIRQKEQRRGKKTNLRANDTVSSKVILHGSSVLSKLSEVDGVCKSK